MPLYDDDLPTKQEETLLKNLVDNIEHDQRLENLTRVKFKLMFSIIECCLFISVEKLDNWFASM